MSLKNDKMPIVAILHAYQPPTQTSEIIDRIVKNCYLPVVQALENNHDLKLTLNINASLTELLEDDYGVVIEKFSELARNGQVEFLESGAYHPILPLLSQKEARIQIELNRKINSQVFGTVWKPRGFWPPELAVSENLTFLIENLGYEYMIVPEISISSNAPFPTSLLSRLLVHPNAPKLALINRNREVSNNISFKKYNNIQSAQEHVLNLKKLSSEGVIVFATDLETFGEHHPQYEKFLVEFLKLNDSKTVSELLTMPRQPIVELRSSSWSTSEEDLYRDIPFPLWAYPGNSVHEILNYHNDILSEVIDYLLLIKDESDYEVKMAMKAVSKAQYSCTSWWSSTRDHFSKEMIKKGFNAQKVALQLALMATGQSEMEHSVLTGVSERLEKRLDRYLARIR